MESAVRSGTYRGIGPDKGFLKSIAGSFILHIIILAFALFLYKGPRNYILPSVYTVNLIGPGSGGPGKGTVGAETDSSDRPGGYKGSGGPGKGTVGAETQTLKPQNTEPPAALKKEGPQAHNIRPRATLKPKVVVDTVDTKNAVSIKAAVNKVKEKVKEKEESSLVESRVENLKKKIASAPSVDRSIEELKKQIDKEASRGGKAGAAMGEGRGGSAGQGSGGGISGGNGEGRGGSAGQGSGGGISGGNIESRYKAYYSAIRNNVQEAWIYPEGFDNKKISVIVSVKISITGKLLDSWVEASSGNPRFDESLLDAIKKASPFPPLPQDFEGAYLETGFRFCNPPCN